VSNERDNAEQLASWVRAILADFLDPIPLRLDRTLFLRRMERLAALIAFWGTRINLTAAPTNPREVAFHLLDSLAPIIFSGDDQLLYRAFDDPGRQLLDLGSGAGFPGLVLAAASPASFTLVESRRKRSSFLGATAAEMGLKNVAVSQRLPILPQRGSSSSCERRDTTFSPTSGIQKQARFDAVTARAFAAAPTFHSTAGSFLKPGGIAILYANPGQNLALPEAEKNGCYEFRLVPYTVPRGSGRIQRVLGLWERR
jgi:16S rRNA (guanine(527)-N(7))-methyltransferase RsmG